MTSYKPLVNEREKQVAQKRMFVFSSFILHFFFHSFGFIFFCFFVFCFCVFLGFLFVFGSSMPLNHAIDEIGYGPFQVYCAYLIVH